MKEELICPVYTGTIKTNDLPTVEGGNEDFRIMMIILVRQNGNVCKYIHINKGFAILLGIHEMLEAFGTALTQACLKNEVCFDVVVRNIYCKLIETVQFYGNHWT
jgi:hypothetical protein